MQGYDKISRKKDKEMFFSDEMGIRLSEISKPKKHWMQTGIELENERVDDDIKLNCWGEYHGKEQPLCIIFQKILITPCTKR